MRPKGNLNIDISLALFVAAVMIPFLVLGSGRCSATTWNISSKKQMFIDNRFIESSDNVTLRPHQAQRLGMAPMAAGQDWNDLVGGYMRVIDDGGVFKLYYSSGHLTEGLCYIESTDGIHFTATDLGLGMVPTNKIPGMSLDATIMVDPHDIAERRYKMFMTDWWDYPGPGPEGPGVYGFYSADGIHFTSVGRVLPLRPETNIIADWDARIGRYVVWLRVFQSGTENQRRHARFETDDLLAPWPYSGTIPPDFRATPEHFPVVLSVDASDDPYSDMYTSAACIYPYAQDVYLAFPSLFRHFNPARQPWFAFKEGEDYGFLGPQLAVSRDGINWQRDFRQPYAVMGLPDEWDRWMNMVGVGMVRKGNYLYQYYRSSSRMHDGGLLRPEYESLVPYENHLGILRQRLDGFISADFAYTGGSLLTPLMTFSGDHLELNIDTGAMGGMRVELRDSNNDPISGFTKAACEEIGGNFVDTTVGWNGNTDVSGLAGLPVRLYFEGRGAKLYAFQFPGAASSGPTCDGSIFSDDFSIWDAAKWGKAFSPSGGTDPFSVSGGALTFNTTYADQDGHIWTLPALDYGSLTDYAAEIQFKVKSGTFVLGDGERNVVLLGGEASDFSEPRDFIISLWNGSTSDKFKLGWSWWVGPTPEVLTGDLDRNTWHTVLARHRSDDMVDIYVDRNYVATRAALSYGGSTRTNRLRMSDLSGSVYVNMDVDYIKMGAFVP